MKGLGKVKMNVKKGDVVFIKPIKKLSVVKEVSTTQLLVRFVDSNGKHRSNWYQKHDAVFLVAGSQFVDADPPAHDSTTRLFPEKGRDD